MCILSIYSKPNGDFILTQNRDENIFRPTSKSIKIKEIHNQKYTGPVDLTSGGTWIYHSENYVVCVLNGEFKKHLNNPPYRMSRGLVILELLNYNSSKDFLDEINLQEIEPFTMVIIELKTQMKSILVWDGNQKHVENVSEIELITKSSSTLYDENEKNFHKQHFQQLRNVSPQKIMEIHSQLKMIENEKYPNIQTTSITQIIYENSKIELKFCQI